MSEVANAVAAAFRPSAAPFAVSSAVRALVAGGTLLLLGWTIGDWDRLGVAYLGAACSVAFVVGDSYRGRVTGLCAQAAGAVLGLVVAGSSGGGAMTMVVVATAAGAVSGLVGAVGPAGPAFGMMLSIGVAFGQFGGSSLGPIAQALWYLVGAIVVGVVHFADWPFSRGVAHRRATIGVYDAGADLCEAIGRRDAHGARSRMAAASAKARNAGWDARAERVAHAIAALYAEGSPVPPQVVAGLRTAARQLRAGDPVEVSARWTATAGLRAMTQALSGPGSQPPRVVDHDLHPPLLPSLTGAAVPNAVRMAVCLGVATTVTLAAHDPRHSFWLPLTVAVIVRPEYASIVVRTVNRIAGTIIGALVAAAVLMLWDNGFAIAFAASLGLAFAALTAPKLYALSVIGLTLSAILASSMGHADIETPAIRVLDTVIGAVIAVVFGYLLWPGARRLPQQARLDDALDAATRYLDDAAAGPSRDRTAFVRHRDDAYLRAHGAKAACLAAFAEPPPIPARARQMLPLAMEVKEIVDEITLISLSVDGADPPTAPAVDRTRERLHDLRSAASAAAAP
ncbi:FUSC family protein [Branchiibius cervicis]|uniref:FUSC family protein n=1 Tax=Branchiibius cervicis TaxID=908252 RepID=A0ABW2APJ6_9MICO